jgi:hypothetical protein
MPPAIVARIADSEPVREQPNKYGPGVSPAWDAAGNVVSISFADNFTRELASDWLTTHGYENAGIESTEPVRHALAFGISSTGSNMERNGDALTIKGVRLLAEGKWTDSLQKTPWRVNSDVLLRNASNWTDDTVWNRHAGGQHRAVTDKIGEVHNIGYDNGAVVGDVYLHGLTQNSRDAASLVENGKINYVSVETVGKDRWNVGTKEFEAQDITFTGLALVNRGACAVCTLRENEGGADVTESARENETVSESDSLEAKRSEIASTLGAHLGMKYPDGSPRSPWVKLTTGNNVIYEGTEDGEMFRIPYMIDAGSITFGTPTPTEMIYKDKELSGDTMTPEEIAAMKADITKELSGVYDGKLKELSDKLTAAEQKNAELSTKVKEFSEAEDRIKTLSEADSRELATPEGFQVEIGADGDVCRVM